MARNLSVANDVYIALRKRKRADESFSDVLRRLLNTKPPIVEVMGKGLLSQEDWDRVKRELASMQTKSLERIGREAS